MFVRDVDAAAAREVEGVEGDEGGYEGERGDCCPVGEGCREVAGLVVALVNLSRRNKVSSETAKQRGAQDAGTTREETALERSKASREGRGLRRGRRDLQRTSSKMKPCSQQAGQRV